MAKNKILLIGIVIVAVAVIAYFAFFHPPYSKKEDLEGTIGKVEQGTKFNIQLIEVETGVVLGGRIMYLIQ